jgi:hypothetical protein
MSQVIITDVSNTVCIDHFEAQYADLDFQRNAVKLYDIECCGILATSKDPGKN